MNSRMILALPLAAALTGCNSEPKPVPVHPVTGQVLYDGRPAAGVQVYFFPTSAPTVPQVPANPHAVTGTDGRFTLSTYGEGDGAPEGGYQVLLLWPKEGGSESDEEAESDRLLGWYSAAHSKLTAHVKPGPNTLSPYRLAAVSKPPPPTEGIPGRN